MGKSLNYHLFKKKIKLKENSNCFIFIQITKLLASIQYFLKIFEIYNF